MDTITHYLQTLRRKVFFNDIRLFFWRMYFVFIVFLFVIIILESLLYLSILQRKAIVFGFSGFSIAVIFSTMIYGIFVFSDRIKKYQLSTLALEAGEAGMEKKDMLLNAYQLENQKESSYSLDLEKSFIEAVRSKLIDPKSSSLIRSDLINKWKTILFYAFMFISVFIYSSWKHSVSSVYRLAHINTTFSPPVPFELKSESKYIAILGGENATVNFSASGNAPDSLFIEFKPLAYQKDKDSLIVKTAYNENGIYETDLSEVFQNYRYRAYLPSTKFWQPWNEISSKSYSISVTDRPSISDLVIKINYPNYTGLAPKTQKANQSEILALPGSEIDVSLRSNINLEEARLILNGNDLDMLVRNRTAKLTIPMTDSSTFFISLKDERGITNRNPIPFHLKFVDDLYPRISVIKPAPIIELGGDQAIPILMNIDDDFGFTKLQLSYEIHRPNYIDAEPKISMFSISSLDTSKSQQQVATNWEVQGLGLMPEDELHFRFELYDNDIVSGPKKQISDIFIAKVPSLNDLFMSYENKEEDIISEAQKEFELVRKLKDRIEKTRLELLKTDKPDWEQQQAIKNSLDEAKDQIENFQKLNEKLDQLNSQANKHDLFSKEMLAKFNDLQKLIEEILPPELLNDLDRMQEALDALDIDDMISALENMSNNMNHMEKELDRFLDIFERVKAEQKIDEVRKRLKELVNNQDNVDRQIRSTNNTTDFSQFKRLSQEEKLIQKEMNDVLNEIDSSIDPIKRFSRKTAQGLESLSESSEVKMAKGHIRDAIKKLNEQKPFEAMDASFSGLQSMQSIQNSMDQISQDFQKQTTREMAKKFRGILKDLLSISKSQESLQKETSEIPANSPRQNDLANKQQVLQDQLIQTMSKAMDLSKETFLVTPEMGQKLGKANAQMAASKTKLAERNSRGSLGNQGSAMMNLNESARSIIQTINKMQADGSASGYEEFLSQMEKMSNQQRNVNEQGMQLALGQMASSAQQNLLSKMLGQQRDIQNSLKQLMRELEENGDGSLGDLGGVARDIEEVINQLGQNNFDRSVMDRQQQILTRMLNAQNSMTERGLNDERKSKTSFGLVSKAPSGLPDDLGQRQLLVSKAMDDALSAGFSRDYQTMIRRYFNSLNDTGLLYRMDSTVVR